MFLQKFLVSLSVNLRSLFFWWQFSLAWTSFTEQFVILDRFEFHAFKNFEHTYAKAASHWLPRGHWPTVALSDWKLNVWNFCWTFSLLSFVCFVLLPKHSSAKNNKSQCGFKFLRILFSEEQMFTIISMQKRIGFCRSLIKYGHKGLLLEFESFGIWVFWVRMFSVSYFLSHQLSAISPSTVWQV